MLSPSDAYNFGLTRAKNVGPKNMEYLSTKIVEHPWFIILTDLYFDMM